jgi:hypothetical protein
VRSALNHLVCALVPAGQVHRRHQFPIFDTQHAWKSEFGGKRSDKMLDFVDPVHFTLIESVQPYQPAGLGRLALLERFSNNDKHRLIHAVTSLTDQPQITVQWAILTTVISADYRPGKPIRDGDELARFKPNVYTGIRIRPEGLVEITDAEMRASAGFKCTTVFGEPGNEDTRLGDFRETLNDIRQWSVSSDQTVINARCSPSAPGAYFPATRLEGGRVKGPLLSAHQLSLHLTYCFELFLLRHWRSARPEVGFACVCVVHNAPTR